MTAAGVTGGDPTKVSKAGDTMSGALVLSGDPVLPLGATTKQYSDTHGGGGGGVQLGGDLGGSNATPTVTGSHFASPLPLAQGGTNAGNAAGARTQLGVITSIAGSSAVGDTASAGAAADFAASDHRHGRESFGAVAPQTAYGAGSGNGSAVTVAHSDHTHGTPGLTVVAPAVTLGIGTAAALGTAVLPALADHVHPVAGAAAPTNSAVGDAAATGNATTFAGSDHRHGRESFGAAPATTLAIGTAAAAGTATTPAHSDHVHPMAASATAGASAVGDGASAGAAATFAASDHRHARETFAAPAAATSYGLGAVTGTATTVAHSDHTHGTPSLTTTAPATTLGIGTAAALGSAVLPALADHVHPTAAAGAPGPSAVGDTSATGVATTPAASDHRHARESFGGAPATTLAIGTAAAAGSALTPAHSDHVHPMAASAAAGASAVGDTVGAGVASTFAASDHRHGRETFAAPGSSAVGDAAAAGSSTSVSHADHVHGREAFGAVTALAAFGTGSANGSATTVSHSDHNHGAPALPAGSTSTSGIVQIDGTASDFQPLGPAAAGVVGKVADAGHVHPLQPWQFSVAAYSAVGDLNCVVDAVCTSGSAVVTSVAGKFTVGDVGKTVVGKNMLSSGQTSLVTTVASYQSTTQVTLSSNATASATGVQLVWGTDDTAHLQAAIDAAMAYRSPFGIAAQVIVPIAPGGFGYMVAGPLKSTDGVNAVYNSQLTIAVHSDRLPGLTLEFVGPTDGGLTRHWNQDYPTFTGATWFSAGVFASQAAQATTDPHSVANGGNPSCLGGPTGKNGYGVTGTNPLFNNVTVVLRNMSIMNTHSSSGWSYMPYNFHGMARSHLTRCSFGTSGVVQYYTGAGGSGGNTDFTNPATFSGGASIGGLLPAAGNNASNRVEDCVWNGGFTYGPVLTEHTVCKGINTVLYCWGGVGVAGNYGDGGSGAGSLHAIELGQWCVEACSYHLVVWGAGAGGIGPFVRGTIDTEGSVQIRGNTNVAANLQALMGELHLTGSPSTPTFTFATGLRLIKETIAHGPAASPVYVLGTAQINTFYRDATVTISGGTVTAVKVSVLAGGASAPAMTTLAGFTAGTFRVPAGCWWEIDGSVQPTSMQWILD